LFPPHAPNRTLDLVEKGNFSLSGETIPPGDTTFVIATLSRDNFAYGHIDVIVPHSISYTRKRGMGGYIEVTRDVDDAWAELDEYSVTTIASYPAGFPYTVWEYWQRYRKYSTENYLSSAHYNSSGGASRIKHAQIDGDELKLTILNTHPSVNSIINLIGFYRVEGIYTA